MKEKLAILVLEQLLLIPALAETINENLTVNGKIHINDLEATLSSPGNYLSFTGNGTAHRVYQFYSGESTSGNRFTRMELYNCDTSLNFTKNIQFHTAGDSFFNGGNVGIGNIDPSERLDISGNLKLTNGIILGGWSNGTAGFTLEPGGPKSTFRFDSKRLRFWTPDIGEIMTINDSGMVGIGTVSPTHKLSVNGTIQAKEVIVESGWSDFVFEDSYRLRSLEEVENHIEEYGHLPDVPSAAVVESEGLSVGEAQKIMMQKIEELTLYMIDLKKENEALKAEVGAQREEIEKLKSN